MKKQIPPFKYMAKVQELLSKPISERKIKMRRHGFEVNCLLHGVEFRTEVATVQRLDNGKETTVPLHLVEFV